MRFEIFPDDLDVIVDFYTRVLGFRLTADQRSEPGAYVSLRRDDVRTGAARRAVPDAHTAVIAAGWPLTEDIQHRPWGLKDFRILDPAGYYLRITERAG